ncbi:MAG: DUF721 domain-containing protein [Bacteroidales bacterium]|nr:DUF721 domain-containing protein [Bacteroidales bacterium]
MKRQGNEQIGSLINVVLEANPKLAENYRKHRIISLWSEISGEYVAKYTEDISFDRRKMFVKIKSAIIRNEMMMMRHQLLQRINDTAGACIIDELIIR